MNIQLQVRGAGGGRNLAHACNGGRKRTGSLHDRERAAASDQERGSARDRNAGKQKPQCRPADEEQPARE